MKARSLIEMTSQAKRTKALENRVADLERVLADLPMYIDDWSWAEKHFDVLKTVPNMSFPFFLEQRRLDKAED